MEGILFDIAVFESPVALIGGLVLLAVAVTGILLGSMADGEKSGERYFWAEWPLPGTEVSAPHETVKRLAA